MFRSNYQMRCGLGRVGQRQMQKVVHAVLGEPGTEDWRVYVDNMLVLYEGEEWSLRT